MNLIQKDLYKKKDQVWCWPAASPRWKIITPAFLRRKFNAGVMNQKLLWFGQVAVQCSKWCGCIFANIKFCLRCSSIAVWLLRNNWNESAISLCCVLSIVGPIQKLIRKNVFYDIWPPLLLEDNFFLPLT